MDFSKLLAGMKNEVGEFHPFLHELFKKLPTVQSVHYTHGPSEMGADFLVYRIDPALDQRTVVGVVAKHGPVKMDHGDVVRQIEECMVPRIAPDGLETIHINEVWVAASGTITENAKRKILARFAAQKVLFLPGEKLIGLGEKHLKHYGSTVPIELSQYSERVLAVLRDLDSKSALIPGLEIPYQFPDIQELKPDNHGLFEVIRGFSTLESLYDHLHTRQFVLMEAGMGGGKSRLSRELIRYSLLRPEFGAKKCVPIFCTCVEFQAKFDSKLDNLIEDRVSGLDCGGAGLFIAIDGFDEIQEDMDHKLEIIKALNHDAHSVPGRTVVLTSRPSDKLQASWINGSIPTLMRVRPLRGKRALAIFTAVGGSAEISTKIQKDLANSPLLKSLDASPISYTLLARIVKENDQEIPASVPELFNKYFELVLGRWEIEKGLRKQIEFSVMHACLAELAASLMLNSRNEMSLAEAKQIIKAYTEQRGMKIDVAEFIAALSDRSHVLYVDKLNETIGFRHRGFCEFFYAFRLHGSSSVEVEDSAFHPYWIGTFYFLAGLKKDCPDLIRLLADRELSTEMHRLMRLLNLGHILQAAYMTPRIDVTAAIRRACFDAADLYLDTKIKPDGHLGKLTTMQLLGVVRSVMVDVYGYAKFEAPLSDAICEIYSEEITERSALALLFGTLAHNEADGRVDFDQLIGSCGDALPIEVKFLIGNETKKLSEISDTLRKFHRNLKKSIQANTKGGGRVVEIRRLFESPIRSLPGPKKPS